MKVIVAQKGAREHFLAARALHRRGMLEKLIVDWYAPKSPLVRRLLSLWPGKRMQAAMAATAVDIPDDLVWTNRLSGLLIKWKQSLSPFGKSPHGRALAADIAFTKTVAGLKLPPHDVVFGFSYMSLEVFQMQPRHAVLRVLDQIDPGPVHFRLVAEEKLRFPELSGQARPFPQVYFDRLRQEWELADVIVVNSDWTRESIIAEGVPPDKIEVLPLAFEVGKESSQDTSRTPHGGASGPVRFLWLGQVTLGKGIHYLMEAARLLEGEKIHIDVIGSLGIVPAAIAQAPRNITFHGPVSRDQVSAWYQRADVFVLPTLSDGFALTQLEAMAHGLPVIATPHCGRVVEDGKTGLLVPARDPRALADAMLRFVRSPALAREMGAQCREAVKAYSVDAYGQRLAEILQKHSEVKQNGLAR